MPSSYKNLSELKTQLNTSNANLEINVAKINISTCPYCSALQPMGQGVNSITIFENNNKNEIEVNHTCINTNCKRSFVDFFDLIKNDKELNVNKIYTLKDQEFETEDFVLFFSKKGEKEVFSRFHPLYAEAMEALKNGMEEASGMLLRKCLEALVYDYIKFGSKIKGKPIDMYSLQKNGLMKAVESMEDVALRELSKRAVWIGNDNVHTKKKWNHVDSDDLNRLIGAIVLNIYAKIECLIYLRKMNR
jgi:hypothetical protein